MRLLTISFSLLTLFIFSQILTAQEQVSPQINVNASADKNQIAALMVQQDYAFPTKDKVVLYEKKLINPTYLDYTPWVQSPRDVINYGTPYSEGSMTYCWVTDVFTRIKVVDESTHNDTIFVFSPKDYRYKLIEKIQIHYYTLANNKVKKTKLKPSKIKYVQINDSILAVCPNLPKLPSNSIIDYSYTILYPGFKGLLQLDIQKNIPLLHGDYSVTLPLFSRPMKWEVIQKGDFEVDVKRKDGNYNVSFRGDNRYGVRTQAAEIIEIQVNDLPSISAKEEPLSVSFVKEYLPYKDDI